MLQLTREIPDVDAMLALEPEELGAKLLFLTREREGERMFNPDSYRSELFGNGAQPGGYPRARQREIELAYVEAWRWLEAQGLVVPEPGINGNNGFRRLSRRARRFENQEAFNGFVAAQMLPKAMLHSAIREAVWLAFVRGDFDVAVFKAMKQVEIALRAASGFPDDLIGVKLARQAFHSDNGPLTDHATEGGERQARADLFAGAIGSYKNPQSHRHVALNDPAEAIEQILLASHLLRIIDARVEAGRAAN